MSKFVSVNPRFQAVLFKKTTAFMSQVSGRTHLHSSTAAGQPSGPEIPQDAVFYAPLTSDLVDLVSETEGTHARNSDATYLKDGIWRIAGPNVPCFGDSGYVHEHSVTNRCQNWNAAPQTSLINVNGNGATVTAVSNPAAISAAGLSNLVPGGYVFDIDNQTAGPVTATVTCQSWEGIFTVSAWINTFGANVGFGFETSGTTTVNSTALQRFEYTLEPPSFENLAFVIGAGDKIQFILNQLVRAGTKYNPIITSGAGTTRQADTLTWDLSATLPSIQTGMVAAKISNKFGQISVFPSATVNKPMVALNTTQNGLVYVQTSNSNPANYVRAMQTDDRQLTVLADWPLENQVFKTVGRWDTTDCQMSTTQSSGAWLDSTISSTTGFTGDKIVRIARLQSFNYYWDTYEFSDITLWNVDKGLAWLKSNV